MKYAHIESEEDFQKFIQEKAQNQYWKTDTEVIPDKCKNWNQPWRVDLVIEHPAYGRIGIELKYTEDKLKGKTLTKAINQVLKYSNQTYYGGKTIPLWAIGYIQEDYSNTVFIKSLLNSIGIGTVDIRKWSQYGGLFVTFNNNLPTHKAPLGIFERKNLKERYRQKVKKQKQQILEDQGEKYDKDKVAQYCQKKRNERNMFWEA